MHLASWTLLALWSLFLHAMHRDWTVLTSPPEMSPLPLVTPVLLSTAISNLLKTFWTISLSTLWKGNLLISISVLLWYFLISFNALRPPLVFFIFSSLFIWFSLPSPSLFLHLHSLGSLFIIFPQMLPLHMCREFYLFCMLFLLNKVNAS